MNAMTIVVMCITLGCVLYSIGVLIYGAVRKNKAKKKVINELQKGEVIEGEVLEVRKETEKD